jgi:hypothetical protein
LVPGDVAKVRRSCQRWFSNRKGRSNCCEGLGHPAKFCQTWRGTDSLKS